MFTNRPRAAKKHNYHPNYRPDIDGLRALAIIPVVIFHAFPELMPGGFIGVDIFFVISGYLISTIIFSSLEKGNFSFIEFYARRVRRIFPALVTVLAAVLFFGWFALLADEYKVVGKHAAAGAAFVQNFILWQEVGYFDVSSELKPLLHLWSLAIEEQFYLIFPLALWIAWRLGINLLVLVSIIAFLSISQNLLWIHEDAVKTFYSPQTRFWELMAGAMLAHASLGKRAGTELNSAPSVSPVAPGAFNKQAGYIVGWLGAPLARVADSRWFNKSLASCLGLAFILIATFAFDKTDNFPGWRAMVPVLGTVLLIYAGGSAFVNRVFLANKLAVFIGLISYPLYLWHWPLLAFARIIESEAPAAWLRAVIVVLSLVLAILTYYMIEQPIRQSKNRNFWAKALIAMMCVVGVWGLSVHAREGVSRLESGVQEVKEWRQRRSSIEDNCAESFPGWNNRNDYFKCYFLHSRKPDIAVLGDSHAVRLYYGIAYHLGDKHNPALFPLGCAMPFYDISVGVPEQYRKKNYHLVHTELMNSALDYSKNDPDIKAIVLTTSACWTDIEDTKNPELVDFAEIVEAKMRLTFAKLSQANKPVIFVLDNPTLDYHPKACIQRPFRLGSSKLPCKMAVEKFHAQRQHYFKIAYRVLADYPNIIPFNSAAHLCDDQFCYSNINSQRLYDDKSHLSTDGSKYIGEFLGKLISDSLGE